MILTSCIYIGSALRRGKALVLWLNKSFALQEWHSADDLKRREAHTARRRDESRTPWAPRTIMFVSQQGVTVSSWTSPGFGGCKGVDRSCFRSLRHRSSPQVRSPSQLGCLGNGTTVDSESLNLFTQNPLFLPAYVVSSHQGVMPWRVMPYVRVVFFFLSSSYSRNQPTLGQR